MPLRGWEVKKPNKEFKVKSLFLVFVLSVSAFALQAQQAGFEKFLSGKEGITIKETGPPNVRFAKGYEMFIVQPLDHKHPEKGTFKQRVWVSLRDTVEAHPVVMVTEGYSANRNYESEPAFLLNANQIIVEHRYFSESAPDTLDWQYLTVEQAATDHHVIIELLKPFF
jgi:hypothetical protein